MHLIKYDLVISLFVENNNVPISNAKTGIFRSLLNKYNVYDLRRRLLSSEAPNGLQQITPPKNVGRHNLCPHHCSIWLIYSIDVFYDPTVKIHFIYVDFL